MIIEVQILWSSSSLLRSFIVDWISFQYGLFLIIRIRIEPSLTSISSRNLIPVSMHRQRCYLNPYIQRRRKVATKTHLSGWWRTSIWPWTVVPRCCAPTYGHGTKVVNDLQEGRERLLTARRGRKKVDFWTRTTSRCFKPAPRYAARGYAKF